MPLTDTETQTLVGRAQAGDQSAIDALFTQNRDRLRRMVQFRMDRRLAARMDASDIVQDALAEAHRRLGEYLKQPVMSFYPWLRQLAWDRLLQMHRRHIDAQARTVTRERHAPMGLPDESAMELASRLLANATSAGGRLAKEEVRQRVRAELANLPEHEREVLALRYLEQLSTHETASVLGITEGSVKMRHLRALERLQSRLHGLESSFS
jgi:RNA polymerase sigma-70 factor (ECF subfamily)